MKLGLSTNNKEINEELFAAMQAAGIGAVELSMSIEKFDALDFGEVKRLADQYGIELWSFHLPFMPFEELDISKPSLAPKTLEYLKSLIDRAALIGIKTFIIHASGEPIREEERPERMTCAKESLAEIAEYVGARGGTVAVEDLPRTCLGHTSSDILDLISAHPDLRVCFDTNHLLSEANTDFIAAVGDKIITTHVSDYDFLDEKHWLPGEGKTDWQALYRALRAVGYDGPWLYEIGFKAPKTLSRPRDLVCSDFAENYMDILSGRAPKPNIS